MAAVNAFVLGCQADGLWAKLARVNLFCGSNLSACLVPLIVGSGSAVDVNTGFVTGDYTESGGLAASSTKFLDTGFVPSAATGGLGVYVRASASTAATRIPLGAKNAGTTQVFRLNQATTPTAAGVWGDNGASAPSTSGSFDPAFWHVSRTASTAIALYRNGVGQATSATSATPASPDTSLYVFGQNTGALSNPFNGTLAGYLVDNGLNATEAAALNNRIQALQTALGRNV